MSQSANPETIKDLIGVGFGPSNLALAIALEELAESQGHALDAQFIDKQQDYRWHGETLATQSELQISFLKDLVSLRNPTSPYSFVNYLHQKGWSEVAICFWLTSATTDFESDKSIKNAQIANSFLSF
ncbi:hypothetical protein STW0522PSE72_19560 [Pseudomonas monteilii]|nr:hypothetical protein STW0522PSE72_19560 [Pseudomonas monteilii]